MVHLRGFETQRLADVAQGAPRAVGNYACRQRSARTSVFSVDVLDDFFAPLMFEIDVDVGRFVSFTRDETLEQNAHARGIDLRDAEAIAHGGVCRRAATL